MPGQVKNAGNLNLFSTPALFGWKVKQKILNFTMIQWYIYSCTSTPAHNYLYLNFTNILSLPKGPAQNGMQPILRCSRPGQPGRASTRAAWLRPLEQVGRLLPGPQRPRGPHPPGGRPRRGSRRQGHDIPDRGRAARGLLRGQPARFVRRYGRVSGSASHAPA